MGHPKGVCAVELPRLGLAAVLSTCKRMCGCCFEKLNVVQCSEDDSSMHTQVGPRGRGVGGVHVAG